MNQLPQTRIQNITAHIVNWLNTNQCNVIHMDNGVDNTRQLIEYLHTTYLDEDTVVPLVETKKSRKYTSKKPLTSENQCSAGKKRGMRCSRRHKPDTPLCGTHELMFVSSKLSMDEFIESTYVTQKLTNQSKNPKLDESKSDDDTSRPVKPKPKIKIVSHSGIPYFADTMNNVYDAKDIIETNPNPDVIGTFSPIDGVVTLHPKPIVE